jgi:hypothetical protein
MALAKQDYYFISIIAIGLTFILLWQIGTFSSNITQTELTNETRLEGKNQTALIVDYFNQSFLNQLFILDRMETKFKEEIILIAFLNYESRLLIKEMFDHFGIIIPDAEILNKRHNDYPYYYTNGTHLIIDTNNEKNMTIEIPKEMKNLMMQFKDDKTNPLFKGKTS